MNLTDRCRIIRELERTKAQALKDWEVAHSQMLDEDTERECIECIRKINHLIEELS